MKRRGPWELLPFAVAAAAIALGGCGDRSAEPADRGQGQPQASDPRQGEAARERDAAEQRALRRSTSVA